MITLLSLIIFCACIIFTKTFSCVEDSLCNQLHYQLEMKMLITYFQDAFYISIIDTDTEHEHRVSALRCLKMDRHARPFIIYNSIDSLKFHIHPRNSTIASYPQIDGYYLKTNHSEAIRFFEKMSKQNPMAKVMIQLTDHSHEASNEVLRKAYESYKMLNVATLHRQVQKCSLKFYNPFINNGDYHTINVTLQSDLSEIKSYQRNRIRNLHKYPIRIYIFESPMTVKKVIVGKTSKVIFTYVDGELASLLAEKMNFTSIFVVSEIEKSHNGFMLENGSFSGGIGAIENDRADLVINPRLISDLNTTRATYLQPITTESFNFVIQRLKRPRILPLSMFYLYDVPSRIIALILLILFPIIYMIINNIERKLL
jgi:hypothetical protein